METSRHETEPLRFVARELPNCWVVTSPDFRVSTVPSVLRTPGHQVNESFTPPNFPHWGMFPRRGSTQAAHGVRFEIWPTPHWGLGLMPEENPVSSAPSGQAVAKWDFLTSRKRQGSHLTPHLKCPWLKSEPRSQLPAPACCQGLTLTTR